MVGSTTKIPGEFAPPTAPSAFDDKLRTVILLSANGRFVFLMARSREHVPCRA
jgi:hypothetical protein